MSGDGERAPLARWGWLLPDDLSAQYLLMALVLPLVLLAAALWGTWQLGRRAGAVVEAAGPVGPAADVEYYRGAFDFCVAALGYFAGADVETAKADCLDITWYAVEEGFYHQPSDGWVWPLPEPEP